MSLESLKFWQWLVISILIGGLMGFIWSNQDAEAERDPNNDVSIDTFARLVRETRQDGSPMVNNIRVGRMRKLATGMSQIVDFTWYDLKNIHTGKLESLRVYFIAPQNFNLRRPDWPATVDEFLATLKKNNPKLDIASSLLDNPAYPYAKAMILSVSSLGLAIPAIIRLLQSAGLVMREVKDTGKSDLSKVRKTTTLQPQKKSGATSTDMNQLDALNASLEDNVVSMLMTRNDLDEEAERKAEQKVIRKLNNIPSEPVEAEPDTEKSKEYGGEYYPVVKPHTHLDDTHKKDEKNV